MDIEGGMESVNSLELCDKMDSSHDDYYTDNADREYSSGCHFNPYDHLSDNEKSEELLRLVRICNLFFVCWYELSVWFDEGNWLIMAASHFLFFTL
jgi:hypothetical protein